MKLALDLDAHDQQTAESEEALAVLTELEQAGHDHYRRTHHHRSKP